ncbi:maleylpyruvate isomerase N-terminal domain-containing protein [Streptomyces sp. NPDC020792]|uniref:maleylpyruvate isomerase N-terminal domain-containing protein n=1 Tax=Streptomyces sp. NPDC020792 TaxID=3365089 RepID=UPI00378B3213
MRAHDHKSFGPAIILDQINAATEHLIKTASRFTDADVRAPSLLPAWSRGHVLTHLARNADGGRNLLIWARTGVETPEYPSLAARDEQIEAGAGRSAAELVADLRDTAAEFATEYRKMPPEAWIRRVRWTRGQELAAMRAADSRLCEVLTHHVDLDADYTPAQWPTDFVSTTRSRPVSHHGEPGPTSGRARTGPARSWAPGSQRP